MCIRTATRHDVEAIADLWVELMTLHAQLDARFGVPENGRSHYMRHVYTILRDDTYHVLVAEEAGSVVGYLLAYVAQNPPIFTMPRFGFIADLCVTASCRRRGVGAQLVAVVRDWFRQHHLTSIQLNVAHHNPISQAFWRKIGCSDYLDHMWLTLDGK